MEPIGMMRKKGFELERKDSDDSDEVCFTFFGNSEIKNTLRSIQNVSGVQEAKQDVPKLSKKKLRRMNRLTVAELKQVQTKVSLLSHPSVVFLLKSLSFLDVLQLVARPDVVEMHDVTAQEPKLLVHLKATRNTVPVPRHWCFKRKYLQGKRGIEKPPFQLPEFIRRTGIQEMREALQEKVRIQMVTSLGSF